MRGYPATSNGILVVAAFLTVTIFFPSWAQAVVGIRHTSSKTSESRIIPLISLDSLSRAVVPGWQ
jgi:hypothetical protein